MVIMGYKHKHKWRIISPKHGLDLKDCMSRYTHFNLFILFGLRNSLFVVIEYSVGSHNVTIILY